MGILFLQYRGVDPVAGHVLHIIVGLSTGGAERSLFNLASSASASGFTHSIISLTSKGHFGPLLEERGIGVHQLAMSTASGLAAAPFRFRDLVRRLSPEIIQGWMPHGNAAAMVAASIAGYEVGLAWNVRQSLYDLRAEKRTTQWMIRGLKTCSRRPDAIIYNSYQAREHHEALGFYPLNGLVIPNGFDTRRWKPDAHHRAALRAELGLADDVPLVGLVGRFHALKDVPTFIAASAIAMKLDPRLHAVMIGEGLTRDNKALAPLFSELPPQRFHALGPRDNVEALLPGLDFLCLSSVSEAFPNVVGEAMASGLPCIATDVGDCAKLVDGLGWIVPRSDPARMAEAMVEAARMDVARRQEVGKAARNRMTASYSLASTVDAYTQLYDSIMKRDD